jgi:hypothetical protein
MICALSPVQKASLNPCNYFILDSAGAKNSYKCNIFYIPMMLLLRRVVVGGDDDISEVHAALKMEAACNSETLAELPTDVQCSNAKAELTSMIDHCGCVSSVITHNMCFRAV